MDNEYTCAFWKLQSSKSNILLCEKKRKLLRSRSLLIFSLYLKLSSLDWLFYLIIALICSMPLWLHLFSQPGNLLEKMHGYLKTNGPPKQVLLFLGVFFFALMLGVLVPAVVSFTWWYYLVIALLLAIKPLTVTWFW